MRTALCLALLGALVIAPAQAQADEDRYWSLLRTLVETDTTAVSGSCTLASTRMTEAMIAGGFPADLIHPYAGKGYPQEGGLVLMLPAQKPRAGPILFMAHIDVVPADPAGWRYSPFRLSREGGYAYGRGVSDNKGIAAALVDLMMRLHRDGFRPARTVKVALTCGEETAGAFNGAEYLSSEQRDLIAADIALVPTGGATLDEQGHPIALSIQNGEKIQQNFRVEAIGTGGHASRPSPDNAIYTLAEALLRIRGTIFPPQLSPVTIRQLRDEAEGASPGDISSIARLSTHPDDAEAMARISIRPAWNALLRTTCAATIIETGRQANTIASHAAATVNCRLLPGTTVETVRVTLARSLIGLPVTITAMPPYSPTVAPPPLPSAILAPVERVAAAMWPGITIRRAMLTGATDARFLNAAAIPAYGLTVLFSDPDGNGVHGVDERARERSLEQAREFLHRLITAYAGR